MVGGGSPADPHRKGTPGEPAKSFVQRSLEKGRLIVIRGLLVVGKAAEEVPECEQSVKSLTGSLPDEEDTGSYLSVGTSSSVRQSWTSILMSLMTWYRTEETVPCCCPCTLRRFSGGPEERFFS